MLSHFTIDTPWGKADHYSNLGQGIFACSTSSHGGIFVPPELLHNIPAAARNDAKRWSGSEQWFEEDCCWAHVAAALPDRFTPEQVKAAISLNRSRGF
jgi:hypothetical protein